MDYEGLEGPRRIYYSDIILDGLLKFFGYYSLDTVPGPHFNSAILCRKLEFFEKNVEKLLRQSLF